MNDEFIYKKINENYFLMDLFCKYMLIPMLILISKDAN